MKAKRQVKVRRKRSIVVKRTIAIDGRKTSVSLEDAFWNAFKEIASNKQITPNSLISMIDNERHRYANLASATRLFVLDHYMAAVKRKGN